MIKIARCLFSLVFVVAALHANGSQQAHFVLPEPESERLAILEKWAGSLAPDGGPVSAELQGEALKKAKECDTLIQRISDIELELRKQVQLPELDPSIFAVVRRIMAVFEACTKINPAVRSESFTALSRHPAFLTQL